MARMIACMIGFFLFGVLYGEILNKLLKPIEFSINVYLFAGSISLIFLLSQLILGHFEKKASVSRKDELKFKKIRKYYHILLASVAFILLAAVPFIWWGAILTVSIMANKGIK